MTYNMYPDTEVVFVVVFLKGRYYTYFAVN